MNCFGWKLRCARLVGVPRRRKPRWPRNRANGRPYWERNLAIEQLLAEALEQTGNGAGALAEVQKVNCEVWRLNQEIARLRAAAGKRLKPVRQLNAQNAVNWRKLHAAWKRIEALEAENAQLRNARPS
jgi:hypothetical protein